VWLAWESALEATLVIIGINHRTAGIEVRERFCMSEARRGQALAELAKAEGIDELLILVTCSRTEFLVWANDISGAANSVLHFLTAEYGLKLCEWKNFYRLIEEAALLHTFRLASGLDSTELEAAQIVSEINDAWQQAQKAGACGRFLDAILQSALAVSKRLRDQEGLGGPEPAAQEREKILAAEVQGFLRKLQAERVTPTIVALRNRLEEICRQELESFRQEYGPFSRDQDQLYSAVTSRITQKISGMLARELKGLPEKVQQEQVAAVVERLFHLKTSQATLAGANR
jgi:glutamyl-tRNA reductase